MQYYLFFEYVLYHYFILLSANVIIIVLHIVIRSTGKIDLEELVKAFEELGIKMDFGEAKKLLQRQVFYPLIHIALSLIPSHFRKALRLIRNVQYRFVEWTKMEVSLLVSTNGVIFCSMHRAPISWVLLNTGITRM